LFWGFSYLVFLGLVSSLVDVMLVYFIYFLFKISILRIDINLFNENINNVDLGKRGQGRGVPPPQRLIDKQVEAEQKPLKFDLNILENKLKYQFSKFVVIEIILGIINFSIKK